MNMYAKSLKNIGSNMDKKSEKRKESRETLKEGGHANFREHVAKFKKECHGGEAE